MKKFSIFPVLLICLLGLALLSCDSDAGGGAPAQYFTVNAEDFDAKFREIRDIPGTYVLTLNGNLDNYGNFSLNNPNVSITIRGNGNNGITFGGLLPFLGVLEGELILENINLSPAERNSNWYVLRMDGGVLKLKTEQELPAII